MPVHYSGGVGDLDSIYELARKYNLRVIEDAAHAFGTTYNEKLIGSFGDIACFSFDGIKNITSGEGGCIVATDSRILERIRDARLLGVERDTEKRYSGQRSWEFDVTAPGWRYHMSNIMAAIGIEQLKRFPELSGKRQTLAKLYDSKFENFKDIIKPLNRDYNTVVPHIYVVRILKSYDRKNLQEKMLEAGIQTGIHYQPNHVLSLFKSNQSSKLPITEKVFSELLTLPMHPDLREDDVEYVCKTLLNEVASAPGK